ncbi:AMP-dependent synthetase/ligase [Benzoatithermus flavus]|uniref:Long-chain fatty acid--CoA ligase n=1 Tax=Benzoatithermus flavus TaxID=3108223 RepID=A0ABU8XW76_9PROT
MAAPDLGGNLVAMFQRSAARRGEAPFLWAKRDGAYRPWSWAKVKDEAERLARALAQMGVERGDRVLIVSENRPEWCIADLAILMAGAVTVPAYTTNTVEDHAFLLAHSEAKAVICSGRQLAKRLLPAVGQVPGVRLVLFMEPLADVGALPVSALSWADALALGMKSPAVRHAESLTRSDLACLIYTSGTGGQPKGVMLSHGNIMANISGAWHLLERVGLGHEVFLSFLPLSHAYEHTAGQFLPMAMGADIYYAEGVETLSTNLAEARPTIVTCVPRLFEVLRQKITVGVERKGGISARLFRSAVELGQRRCREGRLPPHLALVDGFLDRLVRRQVKQRFGGRLKAMVSGGAPLNAEVGLFFQALGVPVLQGYGQTEAAPVISVNVPGRCKIDTVGPPLEGVEVRIAEDGEILVRGDLVMQGYWKDPQATAQALRGGWLHTGDIGEFDQDGYLRITDRKKDVIVNSGGDNIAPAKVEGILLLEPEIGQALVYGDRRPHLVALIVPDQDFVRSFAKQHKVAPDLAVLAEDPVFKAAIGEAVTRANRRLSAIERIRKFHIMPDPFSIENGLLTPTLKLRRHLIIKQHKDLLESLYGSGK